MAEKMSPREQAIKAIQEGGSVFVGDKQYWGANLHELPGEAEFAMGDPDAEKDAAAKIDAQIAALQAAKSSLKSSTSNVTKPVDVSGATVKKSEAPEPKKSE